MSNSAFTPTFAQNLQDASATQKGLVNTTTQTFAGKKTFDGGAVIKGDTSGNAVAAGYVGEIISAEATFTTDVSINSSSATPTDITGASITLSAGVWQIFYSCYIGLQCTSLGTSGGFRSNIRVTDSSNTLVPKSIAALAFGDGAIANFLLLQTQLSASCVVRPTSTTTYKLRGMFNLNGTVNSPTCTVYATGNSTSLLVDPDSSSHFYAVRIA